MSHDYQYVLERLDTAAKTIFDSDARVHAVGIGGSSSGYHYQAIRNTTKVVAYSVRISHVPSIDSIPVAFSDAFADAESLFRVPHSGVVPLVTTSIPEQQTRRPLVCGLQIENYDDDVRTGEIAKGYIVIGTLGCFVRLQAGATAILSNNHVVAGENRGAKNVDRITQASGDPATNPAAEVAILTDFVKLLGSPPGASVATGTVVWNDVDAGVASVGQGIVANQTFLRRRKVAGPSGTGVVALGDDVYKIGRTTGLTYGKVVSIATIVGPIAYGPIHVWFRNSFTIEGVDGATFSDHGDSGSAILRKGTGEVLGLLYAGNGSQTFACPIGAVLSSLGATVL